MNRGTACWCSTRPRSAHQIEVAVEICRFTPRTSKSVSVGRRAYVMEVWHGSYETLNRSFLIDAGDFDDILLVDQLTPLRLASHGHSLSPFMNRRGRPSSRLPGCYDRIET